MKREGVPATLIPEVGEGKRGESGHIGYLLRQAQAVHRQHMDRALADLQVTTPQFLVMTMLAAYPGASNAELARLALQTPQTVSVIVHNLERAALVARRAHAVHGRIQHVELTAAGKALLGKCKRRVGAVEAGLLEGVGPAEEAVIRRWLVTVAGSRRP
jgi:DNA-binding MarR family transcriptional regulator